MINDEEEKKGAAATTVEEAVENKKKMSVIDPAYVPIRPSGPRKLLVVIGGTIFLSLLGVGAALALALVDDRFYDRKDLERMSTLDVLAVIPAKPRRFWQRRRLF